MKRIIVWVSILLLLIMGIPLVIGGFWLIIESQRILYDPDVSLGYFVCGGIALLVGTLFCVAAVCVAAWQKFWRHQQSPRVKK